MKIVLPGGSGQVGKVLARTFLADGHDVVVLSRTPGRGWDDPPRATANQANPGVRLAAWDAETLGDWAAELDGADVVINLAGRSVNCRYTEANRRLIMASRVNSTRVVGRAIAQAASPPRVWLQASTATIYSHRYDAPNDDITGIIGGSEPDAPPDWHFSIDVATAWEAAANELELPRTRRVMLRSAMVMSPDRGGIFDTLLTLVRRGLGGAGGHGRQYVAWIHESDFIRAIYWLIEHEDLTGPINLASPGPVPNAEFMRTLRRAWGTKLGLPAADWMLAVGAVFMGTETELILKSRRVIPARLPRSGFAFSFPSWTEAAEDLCRRWRELHQGRNAS